VRRSMATSQPLSHHKEFSARHEARRSGNIIRSPRRRAATYPQSPIPYAAAKAGIQILTRVLAAQAGPDGIRVNCIAPERFSPSGRCAHPGQQKEALLDMHPLKRLAPQRMSLERALSGFRRIWMDHSVVLDVAGAP